MKGIRWVILAFSLFSVTPGWGDASIPQFTGYLNDGFWKDQNYYVDNYVAVVGNGFLSSYSYPGTYNNNVSGTFFFKPGTSTLHVYAKSHADGPNTTDNDAWSDLYVTDYPTKWSTDTRGNSWHDFSYSLPTTKTTTVTIHQIIKGNTKGIGTFSIIPDASIPEFQLSGFPPSWTVATGGIPITVSGYSDTGSGLNLAASTYTVTKVGETTPSIGPTSFTLSAASTATINVLIPSSTLESGVYNLSVTVSDNVNNTRTKTLPIYVTKTAPIVDTATIKVGGALVSNQTFHRGPQLDAGAVISPPPVVAAAIAADTTVPPLTLSLVQFELLHSENGTEFVARNEPNGIFTISRPIEPGEVLGTYYNENGWPTGLTEHAFDLEGLPGGYYKIRVSTTDAAGNARRLLVGTTQVPGNTAIPDESADANVFVYVPDAQITVVETSSYPELDWDNSETPDWQISISSRNTSTPQIAIPITSFTYQLQYSSTPAGTWAPLGALVTNTLPPNTFSYSPTIGGGSLANPFPLPALTEEEDGYYRAVVTATDASGLISPEKILSTYQYDHSAPTVPSGATSYTNVYAPMVWTLSPTDNLSGVDWSAAGTAAIQQKATQLTGPFADDSVSATITTVGTPPTSGTFTLPAPNADGVYRLSGSSRDNAGNTTTFYSSSLVVDTAPPTVSLGTPGIPPEHNQFTKIPTVGIALTVSDSLSLVRDVTVVVKNSTGVIVWGNGSTFTSANLPDSITVGEAAGDYTIVVTASDNAGNSQTAEKVVHYLPSLTGTITGASLTWNAADEADNTFTMTWTGPNPPTGNTLSYSVTANPAAGFSVGVTSNTGANGTVNLDLAGPNTAVTLTITATDLVGNTVTTNIAVRTKAKLGTLGSPVPSYNSGNQAVLTYSGGGTADQLTATDVTDPLAVVTGIFDGVAKKFTLSGLTSHHSYSLKLTGTNSATPSQTTTRDAGTLLVANNVPAAPGITTGGTAAAPFWAGPNRPLAWAPAVDHDAEDELTYTAATKLAAASTFSSQSATSGLIFTPTAALGFVTGSAYDWKVTVADDHQGSATSSPVSRFKFDALAPTLGWTDGTWPQIPYLNGTEAAGGPLAVQFTASDSHSDLASPTAFWDSEASGLVTVTAGTGNTWSLSTWPTTSGSHTLNVVVKDTAQNTSTISQTVEFDATPPTSTWAPTGTVNVAARTYIVGAGSVTDDYSQVAAVEFQWTNSSHTGAWQTILGSGTSVGLTGKTLQVNVPDGLYSLKLRATDKAGNVFVKTAAASYVIDLESLTASQSMTGASLSHGTRYVGNLSNLAVSVNAADPVSSVVSKGFGVAVAGSRPTSWETTWAAAATAGQSALASGSTIQIWTRATNGVGTTVEQTSEPLIFDKTPPTGLGLTVSSSSVHGGDSIRFQGTGADAQSSLSQFSLSIGTVEDPTLISRLLTGSVGGKLISTDQGSAVFNITLPASVPAGAYRAIVTAVNGAGLSASSSVVNLTVAAGVSTISVVDNGPYNSRLQAWFQAPQADSFEYQLLNLTDSTTVADWTPLAVGKTEFDSGTDLTTAQAAGLIDGKRYVIKARAVVQGVVQNTVVTSAGVILDRSSPSVTSAQVLTSGGTPVATTFTNGASMNLTWTVVPSSYAPLKELALQLTAAGSVYRLALPLAAQKTTPFTLTGLESLPLADGTRLDLALLATSQAGTSAELALPAVFVSKDLPASPVVVPNAAFNNTKQPLAAQWLSTVQTGVSPVSYSWALTKTPESQSSLTWEDDDGTHRAERTPPGLISGEIWYFVVRATNEVGAFNLSVSEGITIDTAAPYVADVRLLHTAGTSTAEATFINSKSNLSLSINAFSEGSAVKSYTAEYEAKKDGAVQSSGTVVSPSLTDVSGKATGIIPLLPADTAVFADASLASGYPAASPVAVEYQAWATTLADNVSTAPGVSAPVIYDTSEPVVAAVRAQTAGDQLLVSWDPDLSQTAVPIDRYIITITSGGSTLTTLTSTVRSLSVSTAGWADALYEVRVQAVNLAGTTSVATDPRGADTFFIDKVVPTVTASVSPFVDATLGLTAASSVPISGVSQWRYQVGTLASPGLLTGGWLTVVTNATGLSPATASVDLAHSLVLVADGSLLQAQVQVQNGAGLWSPVVITNVSLVDKTPPVLTSLAVAPYSKQNNLVGGIGFTATDSQSGLLEYRYGLRDSSNLLVANQWTTVSPSSAASPLAVSDAQSSYTSGVLGHNKRYKLVVQARNQAGTWSSEASPAQQVAVDLVAPGMTFTNPRSDGRTEVAIDGSNAVQFVVNSLPQSLSVTIQEDVSPTVSAVVSVTNPLGVTTTTNAIYTGTGSISVAGSLYGVYRVEVTTTDLAGNVSSHLQRIRYNTPPALVVNPIDTTPGRPTVFTTASLADADTPAFGDQIAAYLWTFGDGTASSSAASPTHPYAALGTFTATLTVTDSWGAQKWVSAPVSVDNTVSGTLYANETWTGERTITGLVVVPAGLTLTIGSAAKIRFSGNAVTGFSQGLTVNGTLDIASGAVLSAAAGQTTPWDTVLVYGTAAIGAADISGAERAVTAGLGAHLTITGATIHDNVIGLHVAEVSSVTVTSASFLNNTVYGVKEEAGVSVTITGSTFQGNFRSYYRDVGGVLSIEKLNGGNHGE